jgi:hypothetical protein
MIRDDSMVFRRGLESPRFLVCLGEYARQWTREMTQEEAVTWTQSKR